MMKSIFLSLVLIAIAGPGGSSALPRTLPNAPGPAEITVKGSQTAKPGTLVVLEPEGVEEARTIWNLNYPNDFNQWQEHAGKLFVAMPAKEVCFSLLVVPNDTEKPLKNIRFVLKVEGKQEDQASDKIEKTDYLVLIEESESRSAALGKIVVSEFWLRDFPGLGYERPLIYDKDSEQGRAFIDQAKTLGDYSTVPFLAIMAADGQFKGSFAVPQTVEKLKGELGL